MDTYDKKVKHGAQSMGHKAKITWTQVPATDRTESPRTDKVISLLLTVIRGYATDGWGS